MPLCRRLLPGLVPLAFLLSAAAPADYDQGQVTLHLASDGAATVSVVLSGASDDTASPETLLMPRRPLTDWEPVGKATEAEVRGATEADQTYGFRWVGPPEPEARLRFRLPNLVHYKGGHNHAALDWMSGWQVTVNHWHTEVVFDDAYVPGAVWLDGERFGSHEPIAWNGRMASQLDFGYWPMHERHDESRLPQNFQYLILWAGLAPSLYALARYQGRRPRKPLIPPIASEVAYLNAGSGRALASAFVHLVATGALREEVIQERKVWQGYLEGDDVEALEPLARYVYRSITASQTKPADLFTGTVPQQDATKLVREALIPKGFLPSDADVARLNSLRLAATAGLLLIGIGVAMAQNWAVELSGGAWTTTVLGALVNVGWLLYGENQAAITTMGRRWLAMNRAMAKTRRQGQPDRSLVKDEAVLLDFAFFGEDALDKTSFAYLAKHLV